jgi:transposase
MRRVEQHVIEKSHPQYRAIDAMAFASKNLWNLANYHVRQSFIFEKHYLNNTVLFHRLKATEAYTALPSKVANQVLLQVHLAWKAFFEAMDIYRECPDKFTGRPKLPKYLHKTQGRNLLIFEQGCIWKAELRGREIARSVSWDSSEKRSGSLPWCNRCVWSLRPITMCSKWSMRLHGSVPKDWLLICLSRLILGSTSSLP